MLVMYDGYVRIADFGLSTFVVPGAELTAAGTPGYAAPGKKKN